MPAKVLGLKGTAGALGRLACSGLMAALAWIPVQAGDGPVFPGTTWEQAAALEVQGWSAAGLAGADRYAKTINTDAYLVVDHGRIVHSYGNCARPINLHSMRKSILSILLGIQWDQGRVELDQTLGGLGITDKQPLREPERAATVRQLLQARSGVYLPAAYETREMAAARPPRGSHLPGTFWYYNNWDFNALGTIFQARAGRNVFEALRDDLANPLQFEDFDMNRDTRFRYEPQSEHPAYIMCLSARDLARVGLLMARRGEWNGRRIVSEAWVAASTRSYSETGRPGRGYGYLWWVSPEHGAFSANGHQGQVMIVNPARDLIIVHQVDTDDGRRRQATGRQLAGLLDQVMAARRSAPL